MVLFTHFYTSLLNILLNEGQYLARSVDPCQVGKVRVYGHAHNLTVDVVELVGLVTE